MYILIHTWIYLYIYIYIYVYIYVYKCMQGDLIPPPTRHGHLVLVHRHHLLTCARHPSANCHHIIFSKYLDEFRKSPRSGERQ